MERFNIASMCANLMLSDVDDEDITTQLPYVTIDDGVNRVGYYAVGRLVTAKNVKFPFFKETMAFV